METISTTPLSSGRSRKFLIIFLIIALGLLAYINYTKRLQATSELKKLSMKMEQLQTGNSPQNVAAAKEIIERVQKHMTLDMSVQPTVATIVDVDMLKARNEFYKNAKNGDHLIVTPTRAILYDPDQDLILDVVAVQLQQSAPAKETKK